MLHRRTIHPVRHIRSMSGMCSLMLGLMLLLTALPAAAQVDKFRPGEIWPDTDGVHINAHGGGILFHEGVYYWFGEHKIAGPQGNSAQVGVSVYSSTDLLNWKNEGIALAVSDDPTTDIVRGCIIERPKVIYNAKTDKFVMWFHLELRGRGYEAARSGVAIADNPTGPYTFLESFRINPGILPLNPPEPGEPESGRFWSDLPGGNMARDMTLFVDDDGRAYHIYSSEENITLQISLLTDDYLRPSGFYTRAVPGGRNEAPAIFKRDGKYWMITSGLTGWAPNAARLLVADSIWGPWEQLPNPTEGVNPKTGLGPEKTFGGQSTFILPVQGRKDAFIAMFDEWHPNNPIDGRYYWLPIEFREDGRPVVRWRSEWTLDEVWPID